MLNNDYESIHTKPVGISNLSDKPALYAVYVAIKFHHRQFLNYLKANHSSDIPRQARIDIRLSFSVFVALD